MGFVAAPVVDVVVLYDVDLHVYVYIYIDRFKHVCLHKNKPFYSHAQSLLNIT